jgi:MinD-like ATPase involved in chromosome partitioning or flagellar assembly
VISVHSFRGGTGKSNTTANLAAQLARGGHRVAIVDTDIQSPGIHVLFGLEDARVPHALNDYLWGRCAIADTVQDVSSRLADGGAAGTASGGAVYLVPSSIRPSDISRVLREGYDVDLLTDGFKELINQLQLDYLFVDTHPGLNEETLLAMAISDVLLLLLRPDRQDMQGTAVTVEVARQLDVPRMMIVVNKVLPSTDREALRRDVEAAFQVPVAGVLTLSEEMVALGSDGLFTLRYPDHPLSAEIRSVAGQLGS